MNLNTINFYGLQSALVKQAADKDSKKDENSKAKKSINDYKEKPSQATLDRMVKELQSVEAANPLHMNGGYYADTKDNIDRAAEMMGRGNKLRGLLNYAGVPFTAINDTANLPWRAINRLMSDVNTKYSDIDSLADSDPVYDRRSNLRTARELLSLYSTPRPDPTKNWETIKTVVNNFKQPDDKVVPSVLRPGNIFGGVMRDVVAAPHTTLLNAAGLNGISREDYIKTLGK